MLTVVTLLTLAYGPLEVERPVAPNPPRFLAGRLAEPGRVAFSPIEIDFSRVAPKRLLTIRRNQLEPQRNEYGQTELGYVAPLPPDLRRAGWFLIAGRGVTALRLVELHGTVRFDFNAGGQVTHFGEVIAEAVDGRALEGGFVVQSATAPVITSEDLGNVARQVVDRELGKAGPSDTRPEMLELLSIEQQVAFRVAPDGPLYLLIRWAPSFCRVRWSVVEVSRQPRIVASLGHDCDV